MDETYSFFFLLLSLSLPLSKPNIKSIATVKMLRYFFQERRRGWERESEKGGEGKKVEN